MCILLRSVHSPIFLSINYRILADFNHNAANERQLQFVYPRHTNSSYGVLTVSYFVTYEWRHICTIHRANYPRYACMYIHTLAHAFLPNSHHHSNSLELKESFNFVGPILSRN